VNAADYYAGSLDGRDARVGAKKRQRRASQHDQHLRVVAFVVIQKRINFFVSFVCFCWSLIVRREETLVFQPI